jgi:hypothetical protein
MSDTSEALDSRGHHVAIMVEVREYLDRSGRSPYAAWSDRLNREAAAKVAAALAHNVSPNAPPRFRKSLQFLAYLRSLDIHEP